MAECKYCKTTYADSTACPNCGKKLYEAGAKIIFGAYAGDTSDCEVVVTEKSLLICRISSTEAKREKAGRAFGLVGMLVAEIANDKPRSYGIYDLRNFSKCIYPYNNKTLKFKNSIKLVSCDGKDLILVFDKAEFDGVRKITKKMVENISAVVPVVEDGSGKDFGYVYCSNPLVNCEIFDKVKFANAASYTSPAAPVTPPAAQPVAAPVKQPVTPPVTQPVAPTAAPVTPSAAELQSAVQQMANIVSASRQASAAPQGIICSQCGTKVPPENKFCSECGTKVNRVIKCLRCGRILAEKDKFCGECGYKIK